MTLPPCVYSTPETKQTNVTGLQDLSPLSYIIFLVPTVLNLRMGLLMTKVPYKMCSLFLFLDDLFSKTLEV